MKPKRIALLTAVATTLGGLSLVTTGCQQLMGGQQTQQQQMAQQMAEDDGQVRLPFAVRMDQGPEVQFEQLPWGHTKVYRWKKDVPVPEGLPVSANVYASVRAIDVATGEIVWIDTVNVRTRGITENTGLERLGITMAGNYAGTNMKKTQLLIWNGEEYSFPSNWDRVRGDWTRRIAVGNQIRYHYKRKRF